MANGEQRLGAAVRRNALTGGIRVGNHRNEPAICREFGERRQAVNVMAATNGNGHHAERFSARQGNVDSMFDQPQSGQVVAIPQHRRTTVLEHLRLVGDPHAAVPDLGQIARCHRQSVRTPPHRIRLNQ